MFCRLLSILFLFLTVSTSASASEKGDILVIGDSMLEWQKLRGGAIPQVLARQTGRQVENRAASGAKMYLTGDGANARGVIPAQYRGGDWNWVIVNGGANDLLTKCGCRACDEVLDRIVSADGTTGILPDLVKRIRADGAKVMVLAYYRGNARPNLFSRCVNEVEALTERKRRMGRILENVHVVRMAPAIDPNNRSHFAIDGFHPSLKGTRRMGSLVAQTLKQLED